MPISHVSPVDTGQDERPGIVKAAKEINQDIIYLNTLIDTYNADETLDSLRVIDAAIREIDVKYSDAVVIQLIDYMVNIHTQLINELQNEKARLQQAPLSIQTTEDFIRNLPPKKLTQLSSHMMTGFPKIADIYKKDEPGYDAFRAFFKARVMRRLGEGGNSSNFAIKRKDDTDAISVLRFDNRYTIPRHIELHLRRQASLQDVFINIYAERRVFYLDEKGANQVRTLINTEYCPGSDLYEEGIKVSDDAVRLENAISRYTEMAAILTAMEEAGCVFIDIKNPNWLVDGKGHLRIADTKGIYFTDEMGQFTRNIPQNRTLGLFYYTHHATSPEFLATSICSAKAFHTYGLAKNLYQYVTQTREKEFYAEPDNPKNYQIKPDAELSFDHPVFQGERGALLAKLIEEGLSLDPAKRPSASEFEKRLKRLDMAIYNELSDAIKPCEEALVKIKALGFGLHDTAMNEWVQSVNYKLSLATSVDEVTQIKNEMKEVYKYLIENQNDIKKMQSVVTDLEALGKRAQSQAIVDAVGVVPLLERGNIKTANAGSDDILGNARKYLQGGHKLRENIRTQSIEQSKILREQLQNEKAQGPEKGKSDANTPRKDQ